MREMLPSQAAEPELPPDLDPVVLAELQRVFAEVTPEQFEAETGLGVSELSQWVTYEDGEGAMHAATVAVMLTHTKCPVGKWVRNAYVKEGLKGVEELFTDLHKREPGLALQISEPTWERAAKKKEPELLSVEEAKSARVETALSELDGSSKDLYIHQRVSLEELTERNGRSETEQIPPAVINELAHEPQKDEAVPVAAIVPETKTTPPAELTVDNVDNYQVPPTQPVEAPSSQVISRSANTISQSRSSELVAPLTEPPEVMDLRSKIVAEPVVATSLESEESMTVDAPLPQQLIAVESTPPSAEKVVGSEAVSAIVHVEALTSEQVAQTEQLVTSLPAIVYDQLIEYMQSAESEAAEAVEVLVVSADRLHDLAMLDALESPEAEQIEVLIREWYEELLTKAGINFDEETIDQFIELIKSDDYGQDEGTHEYKLPDSALPGGVTSSAVREQEIGRVAVQQLTSA